MTLDELTQRGIDHGVEPFEARRKAWHLIAARPMLRQVETPRVERDGNGMAVAFYPLTRKA